MVADLCQRRRNQTKQESWQRRSCRFTSTLIRNAIIFASPLVFLFRRRQRSTIVDLGRDAHWGGCAASVRGCGPAARRGGGTRRPGASGRCSSPDRSSALLRSTALAHALDRSHVRAGDQYTRHLAQTHEPGCSRLPARSTRKSYGALRRPSCLSRNIRSHRSSNSKRANTWAVNFGVGEWLKPVLARGLAGGGVGPMERPPEWSLAAEADLMAEVVAELHAQAPAESPALPLGRQRQGAADARRLLAQLRGELGAKEQQFAALSKQRQSAATKGVAAAAGFVGLRAERDILRRRACELLGAGHDVSAEEAERFRVALLHLQRSGSAPSSARPRTSGLVPPSPPPPPRRVHFSEVSTSLSPESPATPPSGSGGRGAASPPQEGAGEDAEESQEERSNVRSLIDRWEELSSPERAAFAEELEPPPAPVVRAEWVSSPRCPEQPAAAAAPDAGAALEVLLAGQLSGAPTPPVRTEWEAAARPPAALAPAAAGPAAAGPAAAAPVADALVVAPTAPPSAGGGGGGEQEAWSPGPLRSSSTLLPMTIAAIRGEVDRRAAEAGAAAEGTAPACAALAAAVRTLPIMAVAHGLAGTTAPGAAMPGAAVPGTAVLAPPRPLQVRPSPFAEPSSARSSLTGGSYPGPPIMGQVRLHNVVL